MALTSLKMTGDMEAFKKFVNPNTFSADINMAIRRATIRNSLFLVNRIKNNIRNREFNSNSELTLAMKNSDLPLLNQKNLWKAIDHKLQDSFTSEIGIIKDAGSTGSQFGKAKSQINLKTLVELMEDGYTITVTDKMKRAIVIALEEKSPRKKGSSTAASRVRSIKSGTTLIVPSRKVFTKVFLEDPTIEKVLQANWRKALEGMWLKRGAKGGEHKDK